MMTGNDSLQNLVDRIARKAPEYLDLLTAETSSDFDAAFDALLEKTIIRLEQNKKNYEKLDEEGLSAVLASSLSVPGLSVTQETHSNGHVDLTIVADHCVPTRTKLGEAKIYDGPAYHIQGLEQLLGRYTTGRENRGLLIVYVRKQDVSGKIIKLRESMDKTLPLHQQGATTDHILKWSFISTHKHSSGEDLDVCHVGCNLYVS